MQDIHKNQGVFTLLISLEYPIESVRAAMMTLSGNSNKEMSKLLDNMPESNISAVIKGKRRTKSIRIKLAELLKIQHDILFP